MGLSLSTLLSSLTSLVRWSKDQDVRILMLGLDSAGKVVYTRILLNNAESDRIVISRRRYYTGYKYVMCHSRI